MLDSFVHFRYYDNKSIPSTTLNSLNDFGIVALLCKPILFCAEISIKENLIL